MSDMTVLRAAVIGAGAAGLVMARHLAPPAGGALQSNVTIIPTVFEMADRVGGTWIYNDVTERDQSGVKIHSSNKRPCDERSIHCSVRSGLLSIVPFFSFLGMYKNLRTNLPKEVMAFPDFPFPQNEENRSFITHSVTSSI